MRPHHLILPAILLAAVGGYALGSAGPLIEVTKEKRPAFIEIVATPSKDGVTRFDITLRGDGGFSPEYAFLQIQDGGRVTLDARLALIPDPKTGAWVITVNADADQTRRARVRVTYASGPKMPPVSQSWSIALSEFVPSRRPRPGRPRNPPMRWAEPAGKLLLNREMAPRLLGH